MRSTAPLSVVLISLTIGLVSAAAEASLSTPGEVTIGRNLQSYSGFRLSEAAPDQGLVVTVTSDDPSRLLLSLAPDQAGSKTITLKVNPHYIETADFCLQAISDQGEVTYTATAPGYKSSKGKVKLARSGIRIVGPFKAPSLKTSSGLSSRVMVISGILDQDGNFAAEQPTAGGVDVNVQLSSSSPAVGSVLGGTITIHGGEISAVGEFKPSGPGSTVISAAPPSGFSAWSKNPGLTANVELPGIGLLGDIYLGKDLQVQGHVLLGEPAPVGGVDVTLTSRDPRAMVISKTNDKLGSGSLTLHVKESEMRVPYYLQGMNDSGIVEYEVTAKGYRPRVAPIGMAPSGFMVVYAPYGPPDEAEVLRGTLVQDKRPFTVSLSDKKPTHLALWPVYLDPKTHRGADMTAQALRPGVEAVLKLENSNPTVAKVLSSIKIAGPAQNAKADFIPLAAGQTVISINTPPGFMTPSNATSVAATIKE